MISSLVNMTFLWVHKKQNSFSFWLKTAYEKERRFGVLVLSFPSRTRVVVVFALFCFFSRWWETTSVLHTHSQFSPAVGFTLDFPSGWWNHSLPGELVTCSSGPNFPAPIKLSFSEAFSPNQEPHGPFAKKRSEKSLKSSVKIKANHGFLGPNCPWWLCFIGFSPH